MTRPSLRFYGFVLAACVCVSAPVLAAEPEWPSGTYKYITIEQPVENALREFGRNVGMPVQVSEQVRGTLNHGMPRGTAQEFLEWICDRYGLVWYYDGTILHVAAEGEVRTEMVKLAAEDMQDVRLRLDGLGVSDPRYPIRLRDENILSVSGPPAYIGAVREALGLLSGPATSHIARETERSGPVRVFRGRSVAEVEPGGN
ncbi:type III secretion protein [Chelativorans sp. YIM 93263]|uniref:type III secretion protein n=1 Tax=Chelativorans sp. YIM 93263 TaxID=2906648 RepID=UPI002379C10D|nr:type III secretion protein [Chelativorans sp. YIM 93263]